jgi:hypothetical protein
MPPDELELAVELVAPVALVELVVVPVAPVDVVLVPVVAPLDVAPVAVGDPDVLEVAAGAPPAPSPMVPLEQAASGSRRRKRFILGL